MRSFRILRQTLLLASLCLAALASPSYAQPEAMPITVLNPRDAVVQASYNAAVDDPFADAPQRLVPQATLPPAEYYLPDPPPSVSGPLLPNSSGGQQGDAWNAPWSWQVLPDGLMYKNYLASNEEGRMGSQVVHDKKLGWLWDASVGGHVGIIRYGTADPAWPEGWQWDVDGVALARLDSTRSMVATDFRVGFPLTRRDGPWEWKFGYYHLSSHLGDLYMQNHPGVPRLSFVREQAVFGLAYRPIPDVRFYSEANYAFIEDGPTSPWEFQFGLDYSPAQSNGFYGAPFIALNTKLEQNLNYSGNFTVEGGWQWRGLTGHTLRTGVQYFNGFSYQRQFYNQFEKEIGAGLWYDY